MCPQLSLPRAVFITPIGQYDGLNRDYFGSFLKAGMVAALWKKIYPLLFAIRVRPKETCKVAAVGRSASKQTQNQSKVANLRDVWSVSLNSEVPFFLKKELYDYIKFWGTPAPSPRSIGWFERFFRLTPIEWRPSDSEKFLISHQLMMDESKNYENLIPDYDSDRFVTGLDIKKFEAAQDSEIRNRVFKSIYLGNLYDDLMPIESRFYSTTADRKAKFVITVILFCVMYCIGFLAPSFFYNVQSNDRAIYAMSNSGLANYVSEDLAARYEAAYSANQKPLPKLEIDKNHSLLPQVLSYRRHIEKIVQTEPIDLDSLGQGQLWLVSTKDAKTRSIADSVFLRELNESESVFEELNANYKLVTTPLNNWLELATQLVLLSWTLVLLSWFLSKKSQFYEVISDLPRNWRIAALISLEETLSSNFYNRKKFHYLVAGTWALAAILVHYFTIDHFFNSVSEPIASALNLKPVDYRISSISRPISIANWALQFLLAYVLILVCWELRLLNECMRIWQVKIKKVEMLQKVQFERLFKTMVITQRADWILLGVMTIAALFILCFVKAYAQPILAPDILFGSSAGNIWSEGAPLDRWWIWWSLVYTFSPVLLVISMIWLIRTTCEPTYQGVDKFQSRRGLDVDAAIDYLLEKCKKIESVKKVWATLASLVPDDKVEEQDEADGKDRDGS